VLRHLVGDKRDGFYVDIGANHPIRFSNSFYFYLRGWRGITIEPMADSEALFRKLRPRDTSLEVAVGVASTSTFYVFEETCYNTFDKPLADSLVEQNISALMQTLSVRKIPLAEVLSNHLPKTQAMDFLSVDAEGLDVEILSTNDWRRFRPKYVVAERHDNDPSRPLNPSEFLSSVGYTPVAQTRFSMIYGDKALAAGQD
jgi:FkbM family methyltransferase